MFLPFDNAKCPSERGTFEKEMSKEKVMSPNTHSSTTRWSIKMISPW
jgi:hypothetical protein